MTFDMLSDNGLKCQIVEMNGMTLLLVVLFLVMKTQARLLPKPDQLKRLLRQIYSKEGEPGLHNCAVEKGQSVQTPIPLNFELVIGPTWTNYSEFQKDPNVINRYYWSYRLVKVKEESGKTVEEPLNIEMFRSKDSLIFPPYSLPPGYYKVYPNATRKSLADRLKPLMVSVCHLIVVGLKPVALITGGTYRLVPGDTPIVFNGSESLDPNKPSRDNADLKYHWNCTQKLKPTFCKKVPISTRSVFIVPPRYVVPGDKFDVILKITTAYTTQSETKQEAEIVKDGVLLEIRCQKNCPPTAEYSNTNIVTFLQVVCLKNCKSGEDEFIWSVNTTSGDFDFDYENDTQFGNKGEKFIINSKVLKPGEYQVTVMLNDKKRRGQAMTILIFDQPPKIDSCNLLPREGESMKMYFHFECKQKPSFRPHYYELYAMEQNDSTSSGQLIVEGFYPEVFSTFFMLPSSQRRTFSIKVTLDNGPYTLVPLQAKVTNSLSHKPTKERIKAFRDLYTESLSIKLSSTNPVEREIALQIFQALVNEIVDVDDGDEEYRRFVTDFKHRAVNDVLKVPLESLMQMVKIGSAVAALLTYEDGKSDPVLAKAGSTICKKIGQRYVDMVRKERFPMTNGEVSTQMANTLSRCFSANTDPNLPIIEPLPLNIVTEAPILLEPVLFEEYPDYRDFSDKYYKDIENLQEATANILEGHQAAAKAIALSTALGEKSHTQKGINSELVITKDRAKILSEMLLRSNGVTLQPSKDLRDDHPIDVFLMIWTRNLLWWNINGTTPASNIVNIEFWHSTCKERIDRFNKPADIFFEIKRKQFQADTIQDVIQIPKGYSKMMHSELNRYIYVRRVCLPYRRVLLVEFQNLSSAAFDGVVTAEKFPTIEDFTPGKRIKVDSDFLALPNRRNSDQWAYIGLLPRKETVSEGIDITFGISVLATCCILWLPAENQWTPACRPGRENNLTTIHCKCTNFSTYAGHIQNLKSQRLEVLHEDVQLRLNANIVIFLTLVATFVAYCLLLLLTFCKRKQKAMVYFLADNIGKHRFAYLVMVTTGGKGTTSNVTIQLSGIKESTPAHVLNYPDPKRLLLQKRSKDVFVVTNETHLGEVLGLELWVDCSGAKPSWYCEEIIVYDLQWKKSWYFQVNRLFSPSKGNIFVNLIPSERENRRIVNSMKKVAVWNFLHTWCFWAHEKKFSYIKRLTVAFSTVLVTLSVVLVVQGVPEMQLKDILDLEKFKFDWFEVYSALVASSVAFTIHIVLTWLFRLSNFDDEGQCRLLSGVSKLCWRVLIVLIVASATFLIVWGFWVPYYKSLVWLAASLLALAVDIIIYENLFIILLSLCYKYEQVEYIGDQFEAVLTAIHHQRRLLIRHFGTSLLRPLVEQYHTPIEKTALKKHKLEDRIRQKLASEFLDLAMFAVYIIILYVVILLDKDSYAVISKNEISSMVEGEHTRSLSFSSIRTMDDIYEYINQTLIPALQPISWYKGMPIVSPGMMIDFCNKYLGVARFRQQRISTDTCDFPDYLKFLNLSECQPEFTIFNAETRNHGHSWGTITSTLFLDRLKTIWNYLGETEAETLPFIGAFAYYPGGGYVAFLGRTLRNSYANFRKIFTKLWIDHNTRSFFVEFLTYNANYNMFNAVRLLFEQSTTGYVANKIEIYSARMIFVENEMEEMTIVFFGLFVVWVLFLFLQRSVRIVNHFKDFYKNFWFWVDLAIIILSLLCIVTYFLRLKMVGKYLGSIENARHNEFIGYFTLFYVEDFLTVCAAFLILVSTARLWKFLRFGLFFRMMERTLSSGAFDLFSTSLAFFFILTAYGASGVLMFGDQFPELSSTFKIVTTLVILSLRPDSFEFDKYISGPLGFVYFSSYLILMQVIIFIYVIIIIMSYQKAQLDFSVQAPTYNLKNFIQEQVQNIPQVLRRKYNRMKGGCERSFLKPKTNEFRYANCLSTQKNTLKLMKFVTKCLMRNMGKINDQIGDHEADLMLEVSALMISSKTNKEDEIFFKGHFVGDKIRIIDEKRITKIAEVVELLFKDESEPDLSRIIKDNGKEECQRIVTDNQEVLERCAQALLSIYCSLDDIDFH